MKRSPLKRVRFKRRRSKSLRMRLASEFSIRIRARDKICKLASLGGKCGGNMQAAHLYPKGKYPLLALFPLNAVASCLVHHLFVWHKSPLDAAEWIRKLPTWWQEALLAARFNSLERKGMTEAEIRSEWVRWSI